MPKKKGRLRRCLAEFLGRLRRLCRHGTEELLHQGPRLREALAYGADWGRHAVMTNPGNDLALIYLRSFLIGFTVRLATSPLVIATA